VAESPPPPPVEDLAPEEAPAAPGRAGLRGRALLIGVIAVALVASAVALDRVGAAGLGSTASNAASGAWFCPHGGGEGWTAWVTVANPGRSEVALRFTTLGPHGTTGSDAVSLPPGRELAREVPAGDEAAATEVEFFGGWVGAAVVLRPASGAPGTAAMRCASASHRVWYLPDELTTPDRTSTVVVMNPFSQLAEFDVSFRSEQRTVSPGTLSPVVLGPHKTVALRVNTYALQTPGEDTMTATVVTRIGRVVAGSLDTSPGGIRAEVGVAGVEREWVLPASGYQSAALTVMNPVDARVGLTVVAQGPKRQKLVSSVEGFSVPPQSVATFDVTSLAGAGTLATTTNDRGFVAALRLVGVNGDPAAQSGATGPARSWLVLPATPPDGGRNVLVVQNPGNAEARLTVTLLGPDGTVTTPSRLASATVPPGRTVSFALPTEGPALSAVVVGSNPVVAAMAGTVPQGYAMTLGMPMSG